MKIPQIEKKKPVPCNITVSFAFIPKSQTCTLF